MPIEARILLASFARSLCIPPVQIEEYLLFSRNLVIMQSRQRKKGHILSGLLTKYFNRVMFSFDIIA
jgi:hypothetical protein